MNVLKSRLSDGLFCQVVLDSKYFIHFNEKCIIFALDNNPPEFTASEYLVRPRLHDYTQKVVQLIATDKDLCVSPNFPLADCQSMEYLITYAASEPPLFKINHKGKIYFNTNADFKVWKTIGRASFTVVARNYGEFKEANGSTRVTVLNGPPYGFFEVPSNTPDADSDQSQDCTLPMQPRMTIKPPELTTTPSEFGTKFTIQLCLPVDYTLNGILRILGPFKMKETITGGSIHIVGVTYASPEFDLDDADLVVIDFSDVHTEMSLECLGVSSLDTPKRCYCLDILVVAISPPIPSSSVFVDSYFDVQLYSMTAQTTSTKVHFRISRHDHGIQPSFLLEDISSSTQLISGTTNTLALALRTLHAGVIKVSRLVQLEMVLMLTDAAP
uniref:ZP domain-containing protein n=1 Tax=Mesocestoides corti TaxID=53468 RepID=A0A5K3FQK4_MESCO